MTTATATTRAAIYTRVSSKDQAEDGASRDTQLAGCAAYTQQKGYTVAPGHVYAEVYSGTALHERPALSELREAIRRGDVDVVIAWSVDRLSRNQAHVHLLLEEMERHGVSLELVTEPFEQTAVGKFILSARAFAGELEQERIRERSNRGKRNRVASGKLMHACRAAYGYQWRDADKSALVEDPETAPVVRRIFELAVSGLSTRAIANVLNGDGTPKPVVNKPGIWEASTVLHIIHNPKYAGRAFAYFSERVPNGTSPKGTSRPRPREEWIELPEGTVPALGKAAVWEAANQMLAAKKTRATPNAKNPETHLVRGGIAKCGSCGATMTVCNSRSGPGYQCAKHARLREFCPTPGRIQGHVLDDAVWAK